MGKGVNGNLIPADERTKNELREITSKGGKRSGEVRRERKALKETMNDLLSMEVLDTKQFKKVANMGFDTDEITNSTLLVVALFKRACLGDVSAIREVRNLIGEDSTADIMDKLDEIISGVENQLD